MILGLNHNIPFQGKVYHVQTEDSGILHPHIITHVFIGGAILGTQRRSYADRLSEPDLEAIVTDLMKEQHKAAIRALIHGEFVATAVKPPPVTAHETARAEPAPRRAFGETFLSERSLDDLILKYIEEEMGHKDKGGKKP